MTANYLLKAVPTQKYISKHRHRAQYIYSVLCCKHNFVFWFDVRMLFAPTDISLQGAFVVLSIMWIKNIFGREKWTLQQCWQQSLTKIALSYWIVDVGCLIIIMAGMTSVEYQQCMMFGYLAQNLIGECMPSPNNHMALCALYQGSLVLSFIVQQNI